MTIKTREAAKIAAAVAAGVIGLFGALSPSGRPTLVPPAHAIGQRIEEEVAYVYGMEAYVYGFPLIMMDLTKEVSTAAAKPQAFRAPVGQFANMTKYPDASFRAVVRTGLDTL